MSGLDLTELLVASVGALAATLLFLYGAWKIMAAPRARSFIQTARDLLRSPRYPRALARSSINPLLPPSPHPWEAAAVMNPAVVEHGGRVHLFYRAIGIDGVSRVGYASSADGIHFEDRLPFPVFSTQDDPRNASRMYAVASRFLQLAASGGSWSGVEDPRAVVIDGILYLTFNAFRDWSMRIGISSLGVDDLRAKRWKWSHAHFLSPPGEVHKNWLIFPRKINGKFAVLHSISPKPEIEYVDDLEAVGTSAPYIKSAEHARVAPVEGGWETRVRGAGPPPVETPEGWLVLYHAHDEDHGRYKLGAMLLDLNDPTKVIGRAAAPVLEPEGQYEDGGAKPGIVYATGAIAKNGMLIVYYGGADNYVCMAAAPLAEFVASVKKGKETMPLAPMLPQTYFVRNSGSVKAVTPSAVTA